MLRCCLLCTGTESERILYGIRVRYVDYCTGRVCMYMRDATMFNVPAVSYRIIWCAPSFDLLFAIPERSNRATWLVRKTYCNGLHGASRPPFPAQNEAPFKALRDGNGSHRSHPSDRRRKIIDIHTGTPYSFIPSTLYRIVLVPLTRALKVRPTLRKCLCLLD